MKSRIKRLERLFAIRNGLVWHQTPYYVMYLFIVMVCLFSWTCIFMMDSRAWDESESRDQYLHLLHTLTIGVTRTRKIAASLYKTVTYVDDWLNTNRLLRTFNNRFVLPNLLTCYMNQVRHYLVTVPSWFQWKTPYFLLSETGIRFISVNLGEPLDWLITLLYFQKW